MDLLIIVILTGICALCYAFGRDAGRKRGFLQGFELARIAASVETLNSVLEAATALADEEIGHRDVTDAERLDLIIRNLRMIQETEEWDADK